MPDGRRQFLTGQPLAGRLIPDVSWYAPDGEPLDWQQGDLAMVAYLAAHLRIWTPATGFTVQWEPLRAGGMLAIMAQVQVPQFAPFTIKALRPPLVNSQGLFAGCN